MIARRIALFGIVGGAAGLAACSTRHRRDPVAAAGGHGEPSAAWTPNAEDLRRLARDLDRLKSRDYARQGIPMILVGENLDRGAIQDPAVTLSPSSAPIAELFRGLARALPRIQAEVTDADPALLVELVAERDFVAGGREVPR